MGCLLGHLGKCRQGTCLQAIWRLGSCHPGRCHQGRCLLGTCLQDTCLLGTCLLAGICHWGTCLQDTCLPGRCNGATCHQVWSCAKLSSNQGFRELLFSWMFPIPCCSEGMGLPFGPKAGGPMMGGTLPPPPMPGCGCGGLPLPPGLGPPSMPKLPMPGAWSDYDQIQFQGLAQAQHVTACQSLAFLSLRHGSTSRFFGLWSIGADEDRQQGKHWTVFRKFRKHQVQELNPSGCGPWGSSKSLPSTSKSKVQGLIPKSKNWQNIMA